MSAAKSLTHVNIKSMHAGFSDAKSHMNLACIKPVQYFTVNSTMYAVKTLFGVFELARHTKKQTHRHIQENRKRKVVIHTMMMMK